MRTDDLCGCIFLCSTALQIQQKKTLPRHEFVCKQGLIGSETVFCSRIFICVQEKSLFVTFEGIEGSGKSTQAVRFYRYLKDMSVPVILTREPGGTKQGERIRRILLDSDASDLVPCAELFLYIADRAQHVKTVIMPALDDKKWVLCDRFADATIAYQGYARGLDMAFIEMLNRKVCCGVWPDITFLFDLPAEVGLERALKRNREMDQESDGRFEQEAIVFHEAVRNGYRMLAAADQKRFFIVDAMLSEEEITARLIEHIKDIAKPALRQA